MLSLEDYIFDSVFLSLDFLWSFKIEFIILYTTCYVHLFPARLFMKQILEGMLYLHSYGILHRDLTLANLLLSKDMDVVCIV